LRAKALRKAISRSASAIAASTRAKSGANPALIAARWAMPALL